MIIPSYRAVLSTLIGQDHKINMIPCTMSKSMVIGDRPYYFVYLK